VRIEIGFSVICGELPQRIIAVRDVLIPVQVEKMKGMQTLINHLSMSF